MIIDFIFNDNFIAQLLKNKLKILLLFEEISPEIIQYNSRGNIVDNQIYFPMIMLEKKIRKIWRKFSDVATTNIIQFESTGKKKSHFAHYFLSFDKSEWKSNNWELDYFDKKNNKWVG